LYQEQWNLTGYEILT